MKRQAFVLALALIMCGMTTNGFAMDHVNLARRVSPDNEQFVYEYSLLKKALEVTEESDGPFKIAHSKYDMRRDRTFREMVDAGSINVHVAVTREEWEAQTIPVRIPVEKGLLGYRLFLVHKDRLPLLEKVRSLDDLKKLRAGMDPQWSTTLVLKEACFNIVDGAYYEGLFGMLDSQRFDYFPRGLNEIYGEFDIEKQKYPDLRVEPTLALYFPNPRYFFVSPFYPHLAERIERGLEILIRTGVYDSMFEAAFGDELARAKMQTRTILSMENPFLSKETPLDRPELWYTP